MNEKNPRLRRGPFALGAVPVFLIPLLIASVASSQELKVEEHVLSNGMKLLLVPRPDEPVVSGGWVAHNWACELSSTRPVVTRLASAIPSLYPAGHAHHRSTVCPRPFRRWVKH